MSVVTDSAGKTLLLSLGIPKVSDLRRLLEREYKGGRVWRIP